MLSGTHVRRFIEDGFVRIDGAFPREIADNGRARIWQAIDCVPDDPASWTRPVVRIGTINDEHGAPSLSFREAANTPVLYDAFDKLVGRRRWRPRPNVGTFVVRFPSPADPGDLGWHVDVSFPGEPGDPTGSDYSDWRVNITSRDRALLMLFLFSDVGEDERPIVSCAGLRSGLRRTDRCEVWPWWVPGLAGRLGTTLISISWRSQISLTGGQRTIAGCESLSPSSGLRRQS
jgi:hypothetical protein